MKILIFMVLCVTGLVVSSKDRIILSEIPTLTLYKNRMTNGRRGSPVPQLRCVGGSAANAGYEPEVVQCYNRGSDGYDVQWECKADMDNDYRFGRISVSCEGYDYSDDQYILRGSCGLEYNLELTEAGREHQKHNYGYDSGRGHNHQQQQTSYTLYTLSKWIPLVAMVGVIALVYYCCLADSSANNRGDRSRTPSAPPGPPPPGFRDDHTMPPPPDYDAACGQSKYGRQGYQQESQAYQRSGTAGYSNIYPDLNDTTRTQTNTAGAPASPLGGFWSGATMGGVLGYLFGSSGQRDHGNRHYGSRHYGAGYGGGMGGGYGGGGGGWTSGSSRPSSPPSRPSSSGTRTASGFGGTTRR